jgi:hypothetical protein
MTEQKIMSVHSDDDSQFAAPGLEQHFKQDSVTFAREMSVKNFENMDNSLSVDKENVLIYHGRESKIQTDQTPMRATKRRLDTNENPVAKGLDEPPIFINDMEAR